MNDNRHRDQRTSDDEALGAALGEAVARSADGPVDTPPVLEIAERASASETARRVRHGVVGLAAAAALIAGLVTWRTWDGDGGNGNIKLITQPTVSGTTAPEPEQSEPAELTRSDSAPAAAGADPAGVADEPAVDSADGPPGDETSTAESRSGTEQADSGSTVADSSLLTPEELSTGPTLMWLEVDLDTSTGHTNVHGIESVGDGRVLARAAGDAGDSVVVTTDGTRWSAVPMPAGLLLEYIDISGDRWLVGGSDTTDPGQAGRASFSDDGGTTWTELAIAPAPTEPTPSYCPEKVRVRSVMSSGDRIVVLIDSFAVLDLAALVVEHGLAPNRDSILRWDYTAEALIIEVGNSSSSVKVEATHEELGLGPGQPPPCAAPDGTHTERVHIITSDGIDTERAAEYTGWAVSAAGTPDGFSVILTTPQETLLLTSSDGRNWIETPLGGYGRSEVARSSGGTTWHATRGDGTLHIQRSGFGEVPTTTATFEGLQPGVLAAGPAGVVATAWPVLEGLYPIPDLQVTKNGYELRLNEPVGGLTLWDLAEGSAVYEFGPEVLQSDTIPEGVREITEADGSTTVVFEDPDTGEDLVAITSEDLEPDIDEMAAGTGQRGAFEQPPTWIGWSADGTDWGWQDAAEAFGIDPGEGDPWITLAVGDDFVLARVELFRMSDASDYGGELGPYPPVDDSVRWFIAPVP